jgi:hypothetical protein
MKESERLDFERKVDLWKYTSLHVWLRIIILVPVVNQSSENLIYNSNGSGRLEMALFQEDFDPLWEIWAGLSIFLVLARLLGDLFRLCVFLRSRLTF